MMEIEITEVKSETPLRRLRTAVVFFVARIARVPIAICDEFRGASPGQVSSDSP